MTIPHYLLSVFQQDCDHSSVGGHITFENFPSH